MLKDDRQIEGLSKKYSIPKEDVILIALNLCGVVSDIKDGRIRFKLKLNTREELFYFAVCVNTGNSPFRLKNGDLLFNGRKIGDVMEMEKDTCDSTYFRRGKTAMTLNSNSRSKCRGCKFCGTYRQDAEDTYNLLTEERIIDYVENLILRNNLRDLSGITDIGICTGCFKNEEEALAHILLVRRLLKKYGFSGELKYLGSQITSEKSFEILKKEAQPFSLYLTLECFERRKELLRYSKAEVTLPKARKILKMAKSKGFNVTVLYILGLDRSEALIREFGKLMPEVTRFPLINLLQNYQPGQESLRIEEAKDIEYYLKVRKDLEKIFTASSIRPRLWEDYRGLWYLKFANEEINGIRI